jgi:type I restriction enzyme S subunit
MGNAATQTGKRAAYPAYKPSGVAWLGDVPEHWDVRAVRRTFTILNGSTPKSGNPDFWDGAIPWATPDDLGSLNGSTLMATRRMITRAGFDSCGVSIAPEGSLILSTRAPIGHLALAGVPMCTNQGCRSLVFRRHDDRHFFFYQLLTARDELQSLGQGSTFTELGRDRLASVSLVSPPSDEQRAIAAFLDRETARIDALIEKKRRQIDLLQEKRSALISHAVTKGLNPHAATKDSGVEWLGPIPAHWTAVRIRRLLTRLEQGWSPQCEGREAGPDEWGIMKAGCANYGRFNELEHKALPADVKPEAIYEIKPGDVIMSRACGTVGLVGSAAYVENCRPRLLLCDKLFRLHPYRDRCDARYLHLALNSRSARAQIEMSISGADGLANNITQPTIKDIVLAVPPLDEQQAIVTHVRQATSRIDGVVAKVERSTDLLREHRTALISAAVTGKIDVGREM